LDDVHGFEAAGDGEPVSWEVAFTQAESVPEMVGKEFTVNNAVC